MIDDAQRSVGQAKAAHDAMGALSTPAVPIPPKSASRAGAELTSPPISGS